MSLHARNIASQHCIEGGRGCKTKTHVPQHEAMPLEGLVYLAIFPPSTAQEIALAGSSLSKLSRYGFCMALTANMALSVAALWGGGRVDHFC